MDLKITGKRALVMGASSGLGRAIAETLVQEGAIVAICARGDARLKKTSEEIKAAFAFTCDLSQPGAGAKAVKQAEDKIGAIDILVCNTGGPPAGKFTDITSEKWQEGFQALWMSTVESIRGVLPNMTEKGWGRILLVTSVAAKEPMPNLTVSNGLRAGLLGLTKSLSREVAAAGITVNALLPGYTNTERLQELEIPDEVITSQVPAGRLGEAHELAALAAFIASDRAGYVTGQAIACDGGYLRGV